MKKSNVTTRVVGTSPRARSRSRRAPRHTHLGWFLFASVAHLVVGVAIAVGFGVRL